MKAREGGGLVLAEDTEGDQRDWPFLLAARIFWCGASIKRRKNAFRLLAIVVAAIERQAKKAIFVQCGGAASCRNIYRR